MRNNKITLSETQLRAIIKESVVRTLNENNFFGGLKRAYKGGEGMKGGLRNALTYLGDKDYRGHVKNAYEGDREHNLSGYNNERDQKHIKELVYKLNKCMYLNKKELSLLKHLGIFDNWLKMHHNNVDPIIIQNYLEELKRTDR